MDTALKMNKEARVELIKTWRLEYVKTHSRARKSRIIDFIIESIGYKDRKTVIRLLKHGRKVRQKKRRGRRKKLGREERILLGKIWLKMSQPCGKRMVVQLPEWLPYLEAEMGIREEQREKLLSISAARIDRELRTGKLQAKKKKGVEASDLGNLRKSIPIIDTTRRITEPGHLYADTVAHCGGNMKGDHVWTLTLTDDYTLWTSNRAVWNRGQYGVCCAPANLFESMPLPKRSINTDNGQEFINYHLQGWLRKYHKKCEVTRSRPYKKNDNARAEERNRHKVRELVGDERLGDPRCVRLLNKVYKYHNQLVNHFYASTRLIRKRREGGRGKVKREYDRAQTPYKRLLKTLPVGSKRYKKPVEEHERLNPVELQREVEKALGELIKHVERERRERGE